MVRTLQQTGRRLARQAPNSPPADLERELVSLFWELHFLATGNRDLEAPAAIAAYIKRWLWLEKHAASPAHHAKANQDDRFTSLISSAFSPLSIWRRVPRNSARILSSGPTPPAIADAAVPAAIPAATSFGELLQYVKKNRGNTPVRKSVERPSAHRRARPLPELSGSELSHRDGPSHGRESDTSRRESDTSRRESDMSRREPDTSASSQLPYQPSILRAQSLPVPLPKKLPSGSPHTHSALQHLRWLVAARTVAALLHWWITELLELSDHAARSSSWWQAQMQQPLRYSIWLGPRSWFRPAVGVSPPALYVQQLQALRQRHAALLGGLRHRLSELSHASSSADLEAAVLNALQSLGALVGEACINEADGPDGPDGLESDGGPDGPQGAVSSCAVSSCAVSSSAGSLARICAGSRAALGRFEAQHSLLERPGHLSRHWLRYSSSALLLLAGSAVLAHKRVNLPQVIRNSGRTLLDSCRSFLIEHVYTPAQLMYKELVERQYLRVSDPGAIQDADRLLRQLLRDFKKSWGLELKVRAASNISLSLTPCALPVHTSHAHHRAYLPRARRQSRRGSMGAHHRTESPPLLQAVDGAPSTSSTKGAAAAATAVSEAVSSDHISREAMNAELNSLSRLFEQQMRSPAYNLVQGSLLQLLIIQTQYMRLELLEQMGAMDTLLRENYFTASMAALVPGVAAIGGVLALMRKLLRTLVSRRRSRRSLVKEVRDVLRAAERLLIEQLGRTRIEEVEGQEGAGAVRLQKKLDEMSTGLLVISLHGIRQAIYRHRFLLASWERTSLLEDLEDLESDQYDIHTKLLVLQRIYRTQDGLLGMSLMGQFTPGIGTDLLRGLSIR